MKPPRAAQVINKDSDKPPYVTVTIKESTVFSERWHSRYKIKGWWAEIEDELNRNNRTLVTPYGFKRTFFAPWGDELFKEATAFKPQSTVGDHFNGKEQRENPVPGGLRYIYRKLIKPYEDHRIINQSHDSCILEVPRVVAGELIPQVKQALLRPLIIKGEEFTIPVDVEIGERWTEMERAA